MKKGADGSETKPEWLTHNMMAASLGISRQAFSRWGVEPVGKVGNASYYTVESVLDNRVKNALEKSKPKSVDDSDIDSLEHERYRLTKAQADAQELKNEVTKQNLVPTDFATFALSRIAAEASGILDSAPLDLKRKHPELTSTQIESIKKTISKASNTIAELPEILPSLVEEYFRELES